MLKVKSLSGIQLFATPWTVAYQAPPSMGFSRQEYWSGLPFTSPGDLPNPGIEPRSSASQADALPPEPPRKLAMPTCYMIIREAVDITFLTFCLSIHTMRLCFPLWLGRRWKLSHSLSPTPFPSHHALNPRHSPPHHVLFLPFISLSSFSWP